MISTDWITLHTYILNFEQQGLVKRTFRRLDPGRQQAVITAILEEAIEKGPADINIKQVARRAEVSVGSLYQYFGNRAGLLSFAVELVVRSTVDLFRSGQPYLVAMPLKEALITYLTGGMEWSYEQIGFARFFARAAYTGDPDLSERMVRPIANVMRELVEAMLVAAAARGEIRPDVDLEATGRVIHALMIVVGDSQLLPYLNTYFQVTSPTLSPERLYEATFNLILQGIGWSDSDTPAGQENQPALQTDNPEE